MVRARPRARIARWPSGRADGRGVERGADSDEMRPYANAGSTPDLPVSAAADHDSVHDSDHDSDHNSDHDSDHDSHQDSSATRLGFSAASGPGRAGGDEAGSAGGEGGAEEGEAAGVPGEGALRVLYIYLNI